MTNPAQTKPKDFTTALDALNARARQLEEWLKTPEQYRPVTTGIPELDGLVIGIPVAKPFIMLIVATEKKGKTTVAQHLHRAWADGTEEEVAYYLLEELIDQYADRWIAGNTSVSRNDIVRLQVTPDQMQEIYDSIAENTEFLQRYLLEDTVFRLQQIIDECYNNGIMKLVIDNMTFVDQEGLPGFNSRERYEAMQSILIKARNEKHMSIIEVAHDASGEGKAFGSGHANRAADIIIAIEDAFSDVDGENVRLPDVRLLNVLESRLCPGGKAYVGFDGAKSLITPRKHVDIKSDDFIDLVNSATKKEKPKKKLPSSVKLDNGSIALFDDIAGE